MNIKLDDLRLSLGASLRSLMSDIVATNNNVVSCLAHDNVYMQTQGKAQAQCMLWMLGTYNHLIECIVVDSLDENLYALYQQVESIKETNYVK